MASSRGTDGRITLRLPLTVEIREASTPEKGSDKVADAVREVFLRFGEERLDLEALIYFALHRMDVTPDNHHLLVGVLRDHILSQYSVSQGPLKERSDIDVRRVWVHLHES